MKIALLSMPRAGSTIICKFFNSLPDCLFAGEIHRDHVIRDWPTQYGTFLHNPSGDIFGNLSDFAESVGLKHYGFKEVYDGFIKPQNIIKMYEERIDKYLFIFRNPYKQWGSMRLVGNAVGSGIDARKYVRLMQEYADLCENREDCSGFIYESFLEDPEGYTRRVTGIHVPDRVVLGRYVGGGDEHAMSCVKVVDKNRADFRDNRINASASLYSELVRKYG